MKHLFHPSAHNGHRPRLLHPEAFFYFSLIVLASFSLLRVIQFFPGLDHAILGYASNITPEQVILQTNEQRVSQGLSGLTLSEELSQAALAKGQDMFADQYWSHTAPDGTEPWYFIEKSGYKYKVAGENLARDFMNTSDMVTAWMASPTHRANLMNPKFEEIGIAVIDGRLNGFETTLVVQMFGSPGAKSQVATVETPDKNPTVVQQNNQPTQEEIVNDEQVLSDEDGLAGTMISPMTFRDSVLLTPLQLTKAFFLAVIILVIMTLIYDTFIAGNVKTVHLLSKNLGHLMVFSTVAFMLIFFKGGMVN
ncbi:MAG: hypothetical protein IT416_04095 [Candidatus Pacebacteria bacterium]|nr:hypothetical protein [Candidatus Paceibacterota bacterium]